MAYRAVLGLLVLATPVQSQLSQAWPNHALQRSPLCETIHNELLCARAIEAVQLPLSQGVVSRHGDTLSVRLDTPGFFAVQRGAGIVLE